ncbi:hypothetical protein [Micromonospora sp. NPDC047074]|uniref:hypothetical protein n=1 Tax=Micromonospora sp. NPDC047074 TaxID=3154339 RepID=UPI003408B16F
MLAALSASTLTWQWAVLLVSLLAVRTALGLLAEWQARRALTALVRAVPAGLVTVHWEAPGTVRMVWGVDSDQRSQQPRT